jgi:branched-chain amino acid transport system substrate-binding protein
LLDREEGQMKRILLVLVLVITVAGMLIPGCAAPAPSQVPSPAPAPKPTTPSVPIKIGLIFPMTGSFAETSAKMVTGFKFAFEQVNNEVAGRKVEILVEDTAAAPDKAIDKARKLVESDKVDLIIGPHSSSEKLAVAPVLTKMKMPNIFAVPTPKVVTQYEWTFLAGGIDNTVPSAMATYAYDKLGYKKITALAPDRADGHSFLDVYKAAFTKRGGEIIQEQFPPFNCKDFGPYFTVIKDADACAAWFTGTDASLFLTQYQNFGIRKRMPLTAIYFGSFFQPFIFRGLPPDVGNAMVGEYCSTHWSPYIDTDFNKRYVESFKSKYGYILEETETSYYIAAQIALAALTATKGDTTPEKLGAAIMGVNLETPRGPLRFDQKTRIPSANIYIVRVEKKDGDFIMNPVYTYKDFPPEGY